MYVDVNELEIKISKEVQKKIKNTVESTILNYIKSDEFKSKLKKLIEKEVEEFVEEAFDMITVDDVYEIITKTFFKALEYNTDVIMEVLKNKSKGVRGVDDKPLPVDDKIMF